MGNRDPNRTKKTAQRESRAIKTWRRQLADRRRRLVLVPPKHAGSWLNDGGYYL